MNTKSIELRIYSAGQYPSLYRQKRAMKDEDQTSPINNPPIRKLFANRKLILILDTERSPIFQHPNIFPGLNI